MNLRKDWKVQASGFALVTALLASGGALAAGPSLSGPSVVAASTLVPLNAMSLPANAAVTVAVTSPSGQEAHYSHVASAEGTLAVSVQVGQSGRYQVRLLGSGGQELAITMFIAQ
jgi:hypothetical protein